MNRRTTKGRKPGSRGNKWDNDHYTKKARKDNFAARSVYKLNEIQQKYSLIKKGDSVLDLGCSPGSWLQGAAKLVGTNGKVTGIDLKPVEISLPPNVTTFVGDILELEDDVSEALGSDFHVVISDMAPATTGNKNVDSCRSYNLCEMALYVANERLRKGGAFVCKIFQGRDSQKFTEEVRSSFEKYRIFKPDSCRTASKEIYIIGIGKK